MKRTTKPIISLTCGILSLLAPCCLLIGNAAEQGIKSTGSLEYEGEEVGLYAEDIDYLEEEINQLRNEIRENE